MRVYYSPDYTLASYAFETTRKASWVADSLSERPIAGLELVEPTSATFAMLRQVHSDAYIEAVQTGQPRPLAESQEFQWDAGLWTTVTASTGGAVAAALVAIDDGVAGSLSSGLHHAHRDYGKGYCTFNGLALAALTTLDSGVSSILILDFDAHCGGGTHSIIGQNQAIRHVDVSVDHFDFYSPAPPNTLDMVTDSADYLPTIARRLERLEPDSASFGLCLYNAGMDPIEGGGTGGLSGITIDILRQREAMVFSWCRSHSLPVAVVLAGGYLGPGLGRAGLVDLHRLTLEAASGIRYGENR